MTRYKSDMNSRIIEREARHQCFIYNGAPRQQLSVIASVIKRKLSEGYRCLYLNSTPMVMGMQSCLSFLGLNVVKDMAKGHLIFSSEHNLTAGGEFNINLMLSGLERALDGALRDGYKGLWASGDMAFEFGPKQDFTKLMEYEYQLEELLAKRMELCGICQYHENALPKDAAHIALRTHQSIFINETLSQMNPHYIPLGTSTKE